VTSAAIHLRQGWPDSESGFQSHLLRVLLRFNSAEAIVQLPMRTQAKLLPNSLSLSTTTRKFLIPVSCYSCPGNKIYLPHHQRLTPRVIDTFATREETRTSSSLSWPAFLPVNAGDPNRSNPGGANGGGEPSPRSLSGPSPSANLVGIWKGDPTGPACAGTRGLPDLKRVAYVAVVRKGGTVARRI